jgi:hypothetical protein
MRICVSGANNMGKTTFVNDFLNAWPNYTKVDLSYRKKIQEKLGKDPDGTDYRSLSKLGSKENQEFIRDCMIDDITGYDRDKDNVIYDRGLFDNLMYSLYLCGVEAEGCDADWMKAQLPIFQEAFKSYDIILFTPLLEGYSTPVIPEGNEDLDREVVFRSECDNIFKALQQEYMDGKRNWLPAKDTPALIEIFGTQAERIQMTKLYINPDGTPYGEDEGLITEHLNEGLEFLEQYEEMDKATSTKNQDNTNEIR